MKNRWFRGVALAAVAAAALSAAGCGGGDRQDADEPSGDYQVEVLDASFAPRQGLGETTPFSVTVKNTGTETVPNVAVSVDGFNYVQDEPADADPERPLWIVNAGPRNGRTAYVNTWTLGRLAPGRSRTFTWSVTATVPGTHTIRYKVGAGLDGKARAVTADGRVPEGALTVRVTRAPRESAVDPKTGAVVEKGE